MVVLYCASFRSGSGVTVLSVIVDEVLTTTITVRRLPPNLVTSLVKLLLRFLRTDLMEFSLRCISNFIWAEQRPVYARPSSRVRAHYGVL